MANYSKKAYIQSGFLSFLTDSEAEKAPVKLVNLEKWFKHVAYKLGVQFVDKCEDCPETAGYSTVRYNNTSGQTEYYNGTTWINTTPTPAPTTGVVDDTANTFNFTYATGFGSNSDYQQTLDGGTTWTALSAKPIAGLTGNRAIGQVGVRVKALNARPASAGLFNSTAYTT